LLVIADWLKVWVLHSVFWCDSLSMIVPKHIIKKVQCFLGNKWLVLVVDELVPWLLWVLTKNIIVVWVHGHIVFFNVSKEVVSSQNFGNLHKLIVVVFTLEEWLLLEDHTCEHAAKWPDIKRVIIGLQVNEKLRSFKVSGCNSNIVLLLRMIEFRKTPIDKSQPLVIVVDHDIMWLHISMHNTLRMAVVKSFQYFKDIESNVVVCETFVQSSEINIASVDILHDQCWSFSHWISYNIYQINNIYSTFKSLQNLDLSSNLRLFDWFENFDDNSFVVECINSLINLWIFTSSDFLDDFIVLLGAKL